MLFQTKAHQGQQALPQDGPVLVQTAAAQLLKVPRAHEVGDFVDLVDQFPFPEQPCKAGDDLQTQEEDSILFLGHGFSKSVTSKGTGRQKRWPGERMGKRLAVDVAAAAANPCEQALGDLADLVVHACKLAGYGVFAGSPGLWSGIVEQILLKG